jgi:hypothetical protein
VAVTGAGVEGRTIGRQDPLAEDVAKMGEPLMLPSTPRTD